MTLYIKNYSSYIDDGLDIKKELKQRYKIDTRRQDRFIHLAVYGAALLKQKCEISANDELYLTSGVGNIDIVQKTNTYMFEESEALKLFDFINLLGNTTSYYVAKTLGITGKNIFQISDNFTYINTLLSIYSSLRESKKDAIICTIDLISNPEQSIKRVLGVDEETKVVSSVNYQKLSLKKEGAIASIEFDIQSYSLDKLKEKIDMQKAFFSPRCSIKKDTDFFETIASYEVNRAIKERRDMVFVDCFEDRYKIIKSKNEKLY